MKRIVLFLFAAVMACALAVPIYADPGDIDRIHTDASPCLPSLGSTFSQGNIIIIAVILAIAVLAVIYFAIRRRKNKK